MPTVTWPNHTTLVTGVNPGKHGVIGNSYFDRAKGAVVSLLPDPIFNKDEIVKTPTIYDVAKAAGLRTAAIIWPASRGAQTLDWTVPDVATDELFQKYGTPSLLTEFKTAGIPYEKQGEWWKGGQGAGPGPYVCADARLRGAHAPAQCRAVASRGGGPCRACARPAVTGGLRGGEVADERVREVWEELKKSFPGKATLIVASDHGFFPYQQQIQPNVLLRKEGLLTAEGTKITGGQVRAVSQGGATFLYILDQANRDALIARVAGMFKDVEGVELVITPKDYAQYGMADPQKNPQMADLVLSAKKGYSFSRLPGRRSLDHAEDRRRERHARLRSEPGGLHGTFVAWGAGIKAGSKLGTIHNTDVAPTMAALLGLKMPDSDGQVLESILTK